MVRAANTEPPAGGYIRYASKTPPNMADEGDHRGVFENGKLVPGGGANPYLLLGETATGGVRLGYYPQGQHRVQGHYPSRSHL